MDKNSIVYVAGHNGMVGSAICRKLESEGYKNVITRNSKELDLTNQALTNEFFEKNNIDYVFLAAAKVGGIYANNTYPADFMYINMMIEMNVINAAYKNNVKKLLFLGSSCIYPKLAEQPIKEESLLTGSLEPTNEAYAIAKIAGLKYCQYLNKQFGTNYISCMPTNLYGPNDNYHPKNSHVLPALIRRFHEAKVNNSSEVVVWGDGSPLREFLYVDDLASACLFLMENYTGNETINVGSGDEVSIKELAEVISKVVGYKGKIVFDTSKPNGTPRKYLDTKRLVGIGWSKKCSLEKGTMLAYKDFLNR